MDGATLRFTRTITSDSVAGCVAATANLRLEEMTVFRTRFGADELHGDFGAGFEPDAISTGMHCARLA